MQIQIHGKQMKVRLHCRNFDENVKDAIYGMTGYALAKLLPNRERLLNNVEICVGVFLLLARVFK